MFVEAWTHLIEEVLQLGHPVVDPATVLIRPTAVAQIGSELAGFCEVHGRALSRLYVRPRFHGLGLGRALLHMSEASGARVLWVDEHNGPARGLYEQEGWAWDGVVEPGRYRSDLRVLRYAKPDPAR